jgi:hypothetical protein
MAVDPTQLANFIQAGNQTVNSLAPQQGQQPVSQGQSGLGDGSSANSGGAGNAIAGTASGALQGAGMGAMFGAPGAIAGSVIGGLGGLLTGRK